MRYFLLLFLTTSLIACPFCNPVILEKQFVHENELVVTLYCLTPATRGNVLVVPKRHIESFDQLTTEEMQAVQEEINLFSAVFRDFYQTPDFVVLQKNGKLAGQSVPHLHFHLIPTAQSFYEIVNVAFNYRERLSDGEMGCYVQELQEFLKNWGEKS